MKRTCLFFLLSVLVAACSKNDDKVIKLDPAEFYETGHSGFPVLAVDETGTTFGFSQTVDQIYVKLPEGDQWLIRLGSNKYPASMYVKKGSLKLLLIFSDFDGDRASVAVINQSTQATDYFYGVEFRGISKISSLKSAEMGVATNAQDIESWWTVYGGSVKNMAGHVLKGIGCGVSSITAVGSGGMATPIAILSCGSFASSIFSDLVDDKSTSMVFKSGTLVGKYGEMVLKCGLGVSWGECALAVGGEIGAVYDLMNSGLSKTNATVLKNYLNTYVSTGGLTGTWIGEEKTTMGVTSSSEYIFELVTGKFTSINKQTAGNVTQDTRFEIQFNYTTKDKKKFTHTFTRVNIITVVKAGGETHTSTLGPYTWDEFIKSGGGASLVKYSQTTEMDYKITDNGNTLKLGNGQVYKRK